MNTGTVAPYGTGMMQMDDVMAAAAFNASDCKRHDSNWSGGLLARYTLSDVAEIEVGYARKVRSPNIYERYSWGRVAWRAG